VDIDGRPGRSRLARAGRAVGRFDAATRLVATAGAGRPGRPAPWCRAGRPDLGRRSRRRSYPQVGGGSLPARPRNL